MEKQIKNLEDHDNLTTLTASVKLLCNEWKEFKADYKLDIISLREALSNTPDKEHTLRCDKKFKNYIIK